MPEQPAPRFTPERLNAFSDGLLAIVVTILVLEIHLPARHLATGALPEFLREIEHDLLIYAASFWLVGIYWLVHHSITAHVQYVSHSLLITNLWFLFATTLVPFVTKFKNAYPESTRAAQALGAVHVACGFALLVLWRHVCGHPELLRNDVAPAEVQRLSRGILLGCLVAIAATAVSHIDSRLGAYALPVVPLAYGALVWGTTRPPADGR